MKGYPVKIDDFYGDAYEGWVKFPSASRADLAAWLKTKRSIGALNKIYRTLEQRDIGGMRRGEWSILSSDDSE